MAYKEYHVLVESNLDYRSNSRFGTIYLSSSPP